MWRIEKKNISTQIKTFFFKKIKKNYGLEIIMKKKENQTWIIDETCPSSKSENVGRRFNATRIEIPTLCQ